jgi:DNA-binding LacI/PurR family transcriptional regulator
MRAMRGLREWISSGALAANEPLPSERALASRLRVDRKSLRRAIDALANEGIIREISPRTRIVAAADSAASGTKLLASSIVIVAPSLWAPDDSPPGWASQIIMGALQEIHDRGLNTYTVHPQQLDASIESLIAVRPQGFLLPELVGGPQRGDAEMAAALRAGIPVVAYGNAPELAALDRVCSDHADGSYRLTRWLMEHGCRRPAMLFSSDLELYWVKARRLGYERAMRDAKMEPLPMLHMEANNQLPKASSEEQAFDWSRRVITGYLTEAFDGAMNIDGVVVDSDSGAMTVGGACRLLGRKPGVDVLIAGYDNYWEYIYYRKLEPDAPQVTMDKRNFDAGREMVRMLLERRQGKLPAGPQTRVLKPELLETGRPDPSPHVAKRDDRARRSNDNG